MEQKFSHPENHPYSLDDIALYLENAMNQEETARFEEHLYLCETCKRSLDRLAKMDVIFEAAKIKLREGHLQSNQIEALLNEETTQGERQEIEQHISECTICKKAYERHKATLKTIDQIFQEMNSAKEFTEKILREIEPDEDVELFEETWEFYNEEYYDWNKAKHKKRIDTPEGALAFSPKAEEPTYLTLIKIITEIRTWIAKSAVQNVKSKLDELKIYLAQKGYSEGFTSKIIFYMENK